MDGLEHRKIDYLQKALDAERLATQVDDKLLKQSWQRIAHGYRELAEARIPKKT